MKLYGNTCLQKLNLVWNSHIYYYTKKIAILNKSQACAFGCKARDQGKRFRKTSFNRITLNKDDLFQSVVWSQTCQTHIFSVEMKIKM